MALNESALSELLDALHAGDGVDLVSELAQWALQELIEEALENSGASQTVTARDRLYRLVDRHGRPG